MMLICELTFKRIYRSYSPQSTLVAPIAVFRLRKEVEIVQLLSAGSKPSPTYAFHSAYPMQAVCIPGVLVELPG